MVGHREEQEMWKRKLNTDKENKILSKDYYEMEKEYEDTRNVQDSGKDYRDEKHLRDEKN